MNRVVPFTKIVATGNDFVLVDARINGIAGRKASWPALSKSLCERRRGIGADGLLVLEHSKSADVRMRIFNPDGSEAQMCGNGARCAALYLKQATRGPSTALGAGTRHATRRRRVSIETEAGIVGASVRGNRVALEMMQPKAIQPVVSLRLDDNRRLTLGYINTGVPHAVIPIQSHDLKALDEVDVNVIGRAVRFHTRFAPDGTNVDFMQPDPRDSNLIRVRTYERGVEAETLACGTGIVGSAILYALAKCARTHNRVLSYNVLSKSRFPAAGPAAAPPFAHPRPGRQPSGQPGPAGGRMGLGSASPAAQGSFSTEQSYNIYVKAKSNDTLKVSFRIDRNTRPLRIMDVMLEGPANIVFNGTAAWPAKGAR